MDLEAAALEADLEAADLAEAMEVALAEDLAVADLVVVITAQVVFTAARVALIIAARALATVIITARAFLAGGDPVIIMVVAAVALAA